MESPERYRYIIGTTDTIKEMLENQGWTVSAIDHRPDNPYCGSVTAGKGDIQAVTYYFEYHTLAYIEEQFKRIAGAEKAGIGDHPESTTEQERVR
jgi:hypothetical protein